jgi:hypothetical protein
MFVIGNGESRKHININSLEESKVGCNAIFRDYYTDYLVCVDKRMMQEALDSNVNQDRLVYTRPDWYNQFKGKKVREVPVLPYVGMDRPDLPLNWGSGPYAVLIGAKYTKIKEVHMIGFDLYGKDRKTNNIYKDTLNYNSSDKTAVDPSYWIYQISQVFKHFTECKFIVYQDPKWNMPNQWNKDNVFLDKLSNL